MSMILLLTALLALPIRAQSPQPPALPISQTIAISRFGAKSDDDSKAFAAAIAAASKAGAEPTLKESFPGTS